MNRAGSLRLVSRTNMQRPFTQLVGFWLCLLAICVSTTLHAGFVICTDGHGDARVEWACSRNIEGECVTSCGPASDASENNGVPHPCKDTPVQADQAKAQAAPKSLDLTPLIQPVFVAILTWNWIDPTTVGFAPTHAEARPPDGVSRLRSVILIV